MPEGFEKLCKEIATLELTEVLKVTSQFAAVSGNCLQELCDVISKSEELCKQELLVICPGVVHDVASSLSMLDMASDNDCMYSPAELKKMIKRERNPLAKKMLMKQYDDLMRGNGKHRRGK